MSTKVSLLLVVTMILLQQDFSSGQVDRTRVPEAAGTDVVFASVSRIQDSGIFSTNNRFLRRLAYVETRDGVDFNTYRAGYFGGIWQVDEAIFNETLNTAAYPELLGIYGQVLSVFGIDWSLTTWPNLLAPLFSALAARIYLTTINSPIPAIGDLEGQGQYWLDHYSSNPSDTVQQYVDSVNEFELEECPIRGIDLAFVFDSSGSVGEANFDRERQFAVAVTNTFTVGPEDARIANIVYSGFVRVSFFFNTFENRSSITEALSEAEYFDVANPPGSRRGTNTAGALTTLRNEVFTEGRGARESRFGIPRVAVVITDGQSNVNRSETIPSAERLHEDGVIVFAVGVGSNINDEELEGIASAPEFTVRLSSFDIMEFANLQRTISAEACIVPAPIDIFEEIEGILGEGDVSFFQFQVPTSGMTLRLESDSGHSVMYASSKIRNPNSAFYDYRYDSQDGGGLFVSAEMLEEGQREKRQAEEMTDTNNNFNLTDITLYVTVQGLEDRNSFKLQTTAGNTSSSNKLMAGLSLVTALLIVTLANIL